MAFNVLDVCCGAGGASWGYHLAGATHIVGVDIDDQPNYPFKFTKGDAIEFIYKYGYLFDLIHGSPPCQKFTECNRFRPELKDKWPDLIPAMREAMQSTGVPYVIENVPPAPLFTDTLLCGTMFPKLRVYRHRKFESNFKIRIPDHGHHLWKPWEFSTVAGNSRWRLNNGKRHMGVGWMKTRHEVVEAIPPAYTEHIGKEYLNGR